MLLRAGRGEGVAAWRGPPRLAPPGVEASLAGCALQHSFSKSTGRDACARCASIRALIASCDSGLRMAALNTSSAASCPPVGGK